MIQSAVLVVLLNFLLVQTAYSHLNIEYQPVNLLELKHIVISNYSGPLHGETMKLFHNLESLELKNSNFTPLHHDFISPLINLKRIKSTDVYMDEKDTDISTCCEKIKECNINNVGFSKPPMHKWGVWPSLEKLSIQNERLPKLEKDTLAPNLKYLKIANCHLETIEESAFSKVEQLEELHFERNDIKKIGKETLAPLKKVKYIDLSHNKLEKLTTDMFPSLPNLEHLDVGHNPIKEINLEGLKALAPKLTEIDISGIEVDSSKDGGINLVKTK